MMYTHTSRVPISGSGVRPLLYASDLRPKSPLKEVIKYAGDTTLLVAQNSPVSLEEEFFQVQARGRIYKISYDNLMTISR